MVSGLPSKSFASWLAAADSDRRSWPTACTRKSAASGSMRTSWPRSSLTTNPGNSRAVSGADFTSVTPEALRSLVSTPLPFWPPPWASTSAMSSAGAAA